jgi:NTP pyrophosphatase (non-canonical NTP hydrolase)
MERNLTLPEMQQYVQEKLVARNLVSPLSNTVLHLMEEVGEVTRAMRRGDVGNLAEELADCLWFVISAANVAGIDLETAMVEKEKRNVVRWGA